MECIELNWLCKHMKKVWSSQASISTNSTTMNWVKHNFSLCVSLKTSYFKCNGCYDKKSGSNILLDI